MGKNLINIKQRGHGPIILRKYVRKYERIGVSYTYDLGRRLDGSSGIFTVYSGY